MQKLNRTREIASVQDIAIHPFNPEVVYVAVCQENYLVLQDSDHPEWREGGVFRTTDGGESWDKILTPPQDDLRGKGKFRLLRVKGEEGNGQRVPPIPGMSSSLDGLFIVRKGGI